MLDFNSLLIFSEHPKKLSKFYQKVFNKKPDWDDGGYTGFSMGAGYITIGPHDKVSGKNKNPERIMFNLETEDVEKEFERIASTGVNVIAAPYHMGENDGFIATLEDPDGNYFQLVSPMKLE